MSKNDNKNLHRAKPSQEWIFAGLRLWKYRSYI